MKLLLIRHAHAQASAPGGDAFRALTAEGKEKMRAGTRGLAALLPGLDLLAHSPLTRARETAALLAEALAPRRVAEWPELRPGADPEAVFARLGEAPGAHVALVGHQPQLGALAGLALGARDAAAIRFGKGTCCTVEFRGTPSPGRGTLRWLLPLAVTRKLRAG